MTKKLNIALLWLVLIALTLGGSLLGEATVAGILPAMVIIVTMVVKGGLVIDYFMEMKDANPSLRNLMHAYFYVLSVMALLVYLFGDEIALLLTI